MFSGSTRAQPANPERIVHVDDAIMASCNSAVLVHSVRIRQLPANVDQLSCALTITINGTSYTTPATLCTPDAGEVDHVTGSPVQRYDDYSSGQQRPQSGVFSMEYKELELLFPGKRRPYREMNGPTKTSIDDPREFASGVHVALHSADFAHEFGSTLCKQSGEAAYLSYPRGEVIVDFRVYAVKDGVPQMMPLYNKKCLMNTYFGKVEEEPEAVAEQTPEGEEAPATVEAGAVEGEGAAEEGEVAEAVASGSQNEALSEPADEQPTLAAENLTVATPDETATPVNTAASPASGMLSQCAGEMAYSTPQHGSPLKQDSQTVAAAANNDAAAVEAAPEVEAAAESANAAPAAAAANDGEESEESESGDDEEDMGSLHIVPRDVNYRPAGRDALTEAIAQLVPCYTPENQKAAFALYDKEGTGIIGQDKLLHFCHAHDAYCSSYNNDDNEIIRSLKPYIPRSQRLGEDEAPEAAVEEAEEEEVDAEEAAVVEQDKPQPSPRLNPENLYYRPATANKPLEVNEDLFSVICLKLAKV